LVEDFTGQVDRVAAVESPAAGAQDESLTLLQGTR
jgi:hypothetical protein